MNNHRIFWATKEVKIEGPTSEWIKKAKETLKDIKIEIYEVVSEPTESKTESFLRKTK
jgi:hypothetical protein